MANLYKLEACRVVVVFIVVVVDLSIPAFYSFTNSSPTVLLPLTNNEEKGEPERSALPTEMTHCPGSSHGRLRQRQDIDALIDLVRHLDTS